MNISIEKDALVVFVGPMGAGKSTFARTHFAAHSVVSSDFIREQLSGDFNDQSVSKPAFEILFATVDIRAKHGMLTVVDSTGSQSVIDRVADMAKKYNRPAYVFKFPELEQEDITEERMKHRWNVLDIYYNQVNRIARTTFPAIYKVIEIPYGANGVTVSIKGKPSTRLDNRYNYIVVGDLHGEWRFLEDLVENRVKKEKNLRVVQLGDLNDRGESSYKTFQLVKKYRDAGLLFNVIGNHENKLMRYFRKWLKEPSYELVEAAAVAGSDTAPELTVPDYGMRLRHGLMETLVEFYSLSPEEMMKYARDFMDFYEETPAYLRLEKEDGEVHTFVHAGVTPNILRGGLVTKKDESVAMYDEVCSVFELVETYKAAGIEDTKHYVHVGHNFGYVEENHTPVLQHLGPLKLVQHDIGLGKDADKVFGVFDPEFYTVY